MRINLKCPFEDRYSAKALGAQWDIARRVWFVVDPVDLTPFARWLPPDVCAFLAKKAQPKARPKAKRRTPSVIERMKNEEKRYSSGAPAGDLPPW